MEKHVKSLAIPRLMPWALWVPALHCSWRVTGEVCQGHTALHMDCPGFEKRTMDVAYQPGENKHRNIKNWIAQSTAYGTAFQLLWIVKFQ